MMSLIRLYLQGMKTSIAGRMTDRTDYFLSMAIMLFSDMVLPLVTIVIYSTGSSFPGWSLYEALMIQAVYLLAKGLSFPFFFGMVWNTGQRVREGTLDVLLVKPRSPLVMLIVTAFDAEDLGKLVGGATLFTVARRHLPAAAPGAWLQFALLLALAVLMFFAFALLMSGMMVVWVGAFRVYDIFDAMTSFSLYPGSIFSKGVRNLVTMVIPVAAMGSLPAEALLGKAAEGAWGAVPGVLLFTAAAYWFWSAMMRRYKGAGG